jgi:O-antigen ligase
MISLAYAALWFFVFSVPWENVITIPGLGAISRLIGMIALGLALLAAIVSGRFRRWHPFHVLTLLFVIWAGLSLVIFDMASMPLKAWTYLQLFPMLWMIWELAPSRKRLIGLMTAYVLGSYISAVGTFMVFRQDMGARRFALAGFDANDLASALALAVPMAWYLGMTYRQPLLRWLCRAYLPVGLVAIGLTGSRGGMVATIVALLIVPLTLRHLSPGRIVIAMALLCVSGAVVVSYVPDTVVERLATTSSDVQEGKLGGRLRIWVAGIQAFSQAPLLGYGTGDFRTAIARFVPWNPQAAHNTYLSVLVENGLVGLLLFLFMLFAVFRALMHLPSLDRRFGFVLFSTLLVVMLPLTWEDHKPLWVILAMLIGLARARYLPEPQMARQPAQHWRPATLANAAAQRPPQRVARSRWNPDMDSTV